MMKLELYGRLKWRHATQRFKIIYEIFCIVMSLLLYLYPERYDDKC